METDDLVRPRARALRRAVWLSAFSIAFSGVVGLVAAYVALTTNALSLLGFGVDALIDAAASVALVFRFRIESGQPERATVVEKAAERVVGSILIILAVYLVAGAIRGLASQSQPGASPTGTTILVASVIVLPGLARAKYIVARTLDSAALRLDAILTAVAALLGLIGLISLIASQAAGLWWADAVAALLVAAILGREGSGGLLASRAR